jgi:hypothetical protein
VGTDAGRITAAVARRQPLQPSTRPNGAFMTPDRNDVPRSTRIEEALSSRPPAPEGADPVQSSDPPACGPDTTAIVVTIAVQLLWDIVHRAYHAEGPDADVPRARSSTGQPGGRARSVRRGRTS